MKLKWVGIVVLAVLGLGLIIEPHDYDEKQKPTPEEKVETEIIAVEEGEVKEEVVAEESSEPEKPIQKDIEPVVNTPLESITVKEDIQQMARYLLDSGATDKASKSLIGVSQTIAESGSDYETLKSPSFATRLDGHFVDMVMASDKFENVKAESYYEDALRVENLSHQIGENLKSVSTSFRHGMDNGDVTSIMSAGDSMVASSELIIELGSLFAKYQD